VTNGSVVADPTDQAVQGRRRQDDARPRPSGRAAGSHRLGLPGPVLFARPDRYL